MAALKTLPNDSSVEAFIDSVPDEQKRVDSHSLLQIFADVTGESPKMWGASIIGFGQYHYKSERSTQEGDWPLIGFSPRKRNLTLYIMPGFDNYSDLLEGLGKYKTSKGCLYVNKLSDVDEAKLRTLLERSYADAKKQHNIE